MDSFTQILLGIATAEVIAGKQLKNKTFFMYIFDTEE
jgi:inner membrane protein